MSVVNYIADVTHAQEVMRAMSDLPRHRRPTGTRIETTPPAEMLTIEPETVSRFSHQLRSLLTSVGAAADYLLNNDIDRGVHDEMLGIISEQATRIDALLDDFLVVAKAHPGQRGTPTAVDIYQITRQAIRALAAEAQSVGAWLVLDTAGAVPPVMGHHQPLKQAVIGSLRAMLSLTRPGERVVATLEDARGEEGEKLIQFSVLVQSDGTELAERVEGLTPTDLSLEAARRICESHGGTFELLEGQPGVACLLPAASVELSTTAAGHVERRLEAAGS
jgi:signal transduction histidine kinase